MVMHDISIALELIAALLTVLFIGKLLIERIAGDGAVHARSISKRSLLGQQICKRAVAA